METPETRYAKAEDGTYVAYQAAGESPDLAWQLDYPNNVEDGWRIRSVLRGLRHWPDSLD